MKSTCEIIRLRTRCVWCDGYIPAPRIVSSLTGRGASCYLAGALRRFVAGAGFPDAGVGRRLEETASSTR